MHHGGAKRASSSRATSSARARRSRTSTRHRPALHAPSRPARTSATAAASRSRAERAPQGLGRVHRRDQRADAGRRRLPLGHRRPQRAPAALRRDRRASSPRRSRRARGGSACPSCASARRSQGARGRDARSRWSSARSAPSSILASRPRSRRHRLRARVGHRDGQERGPRRGPGGPRGHPRWLAGSSAELAPHAHPLRRVREAGQRRALLAAPDVDGALVGGASLDAARSAPSPAPPSISRPLADRPREVPPDAHHAARHRPHLRLLLPDAGGPAPAGQGRRHGRGVRRRGAQQVFGGRGAGNICSPGPRPSARASSC
jgi:hypothetical protein